MSLTLLRAGIYAVTAFTVVAGLAGCGGDEPEGDEGPDGLKDPPEPTSPGADGTDTPVDFTDPEDSPTVPTVVDESDTEPLATATPEPTPASTPTPVQNTYTPPDETPTPVPPPSEGPFSIPYRVYRFLPEADPRCQGIDTPDSPYGSQRSAIGNNRHQSNLIYAGIEELYPTAIAAGPSYWKGELRYDTETYLSKICSDQLYYSAIDCYTLESVLGPAVYDALFPEDEFQSIAMGVNIEDSGRMCGIGELLFVADDAKDDKTQAHEQGHIALKHTNEDELVSTIPDPGPEECGDKVDYRTCTLKEPCVVNGVTYKDFPFYNVLSTYSNGYNGNAGGCRKELTEEQLGLVKGKIAEKAARIWEHYRGNLPPEDTTYVDKVTVHCSDDPGTFLSVKGALSHVSEYGEVEVCSDLYDDERLEFNGFRGKLKSRPGHVVIFDGTSLDSTEGVNDMGGVMLGRGAADVVLEGEKLCDDDPELCYGIQVTNGEADEGGAIWFKDGAMTMVGVAFYGNRALDDGGAFYFAGTEDLFMRDVFIGENEAANNGGGGVIANPRKGSVTIENVVVANNVAGGDGGGLYLFGNLDSELRDITLEGNVANYGGGLSITGSQGIPHGGTWIEGGTISHNVAGFGGGMTLDGALATVMEAVDFIGNGTMILDEGKSMSSEWGGAIQLSSSELTLRDCWIEQSVALQGAAGVYAVGPSQLLTVINTPHFDNSPEQSFIYAGQGRHYSEEVFGPDFSCLISSTEADCENIDSTPTP